MKQEYKDYIKNSFQINENIIDLVLKAEDSLRNRFKDADDTLGLHQARVLRAFQDANISDLHFGWNTGYGYDDPGRDAVERVFANVFDAEKALVRPNIVNGTHAISLALLGLLRRGDKLIYCTGAPYDTLQSVIGYHGQDINDNNSGTLKNMEIEYEEIPLLRDDSIDISSLESKLSPEVKMVAIQRSKGYDWRNSITVNQIAEAVNTVHNYNPNIVIMVDNCYCEFVEPDSLIKAGVDIVCGSLIKNPGGGLALTGGYICGKESLIDRISYRLTCPGIGAECGLTFGLNRGVLQGLFQAPRVTCDALKGAILCGKVFKLLGFEVSPDSDDLFPRADIIQGIKLGSPEGIKAFCEGIQAAAPVDSNVKPVPAPMPGYEDDVIMAAGTFVQGSSIELSADGPLREPYAAYYQGGLTYDHAKIGIMIAVQSLLDKGIINI